MTRIYLLVEGQTEEAFVNELLMPHYANLGIYLTAIILSTSPQHKGGMLSYAKTKPQIEKLCRRDTKAHVSTMFDLYALPNDFPGKISPAYPMQSNGQQKADFIEAALSAELNLPNFFPNILVHEFEALLFAELSPFAQWTDNDNALNALRKIRETHLPEEINDSPYTAPSKRILAAIPNYQKPFHGPLIACEIGLASIRDTCQHFDTWLCKLESLVV